MQKFDKIVVHAGPFHADDVMTVALAKTINPDVIVERVSIPPKEVAANIIVADIGRGKYDHHQEDATRREDGNKHAACGLFFKDYGREIFKTERAYHNFEKNIIEPIEDVDNGVGRDSIASLIYDMNPLWGMNEDIDLKFNEAVEFVKQIVEREVEREKSLMKAELALNNVLADAEFNNRQFLIMDEYIPWEKVGHEHQIPVAIFKSSRGVTGQEYNVMCMSEIINGVPDGGFLPEEWLKQHPNGMSFVHQNLFLAEFETKEHAIKAVESSIYQILKNREEKIKKGIEKDVIGAFKEKYPSFGGQRVIAYNGFITVQTIIRYKDGVEVPGMFQMCEINYSNPFDVETSLNIGAVDMLSIGAGDRKEGQDIVINVDFNSYDVYEQDYESQLNEQRIEEIEEKCENEEQEEVVWLE